MTTEPAHRRDLRKQPIDDIVRTVEQRLGTQLDPTTLVRKRRTLGARSDRDTWVRIEARPLVRIIAHGQPGDGIEASAHLDGVAKPRWHAAVTWLDEDTVWRADEVDHVQGTPIRQGASLATASTLSPAWWHTFNQSLDALAAHHTTRTATPDTQLITQDLVTTTIDQVFPGQVDTRLDILDWVPTHADLNWSNLLAPDCAIIDWEDFGLAPRGLDAATLWITSLSVPDLAERIHQERLADLANPSGRLMALFHCAKILSDTTEPHDSLYASVQAVAADLMAKQDLAPS